ncbi:MAG TPA: thiamine pyrophosphate-binding protein [Marmoricola sp.]
MRIADAVLEIARDEGVDRIFGNPGTTELPFVDAVSRADGMPYVLGVHENAVVAMADGYARATRRPALVNLHVAAGTANGLIGLLNAQRSRIPLVVVAGQQDSRHLIQDPMLAGDLVAMATSVTKMAVEARRADEVPILLRRAFKAARQTPRGPAFVSVPMDFFEEELVGPVPARSRVDEVGQVPDVAGAVALLEGARRPAVIAGDGVARSDAVGELVALAETLGATVYGAPMFDTINFPLDHPAYAGMLAPENSVIRGGLDGHDVVVLAGVRAFVPHHYSAVAAVGPQTRLIQIDDDPATIGHVYPVEVGLAGDVGRILTAITRGIEATGSRPDTVGRSPRAAVSVDGSEGVLDPRVAAAVIADHLPAGAVVVEEAITTGLLLRDRLRLNEPGSFQHTVGGGLGWGAGAAVGVALGRPGRRVVAALGDGCTLFGLQALWSAAREGVAVTYLVFNNGEYRTLKQTLAHMGGRPLDNPVGMDLEPPHIDWPALAGGLGVRGVRAEGAAHLAELLGAYGPGDGPVLIEVPITSFVDG